MKSCAHLLLIAAIAMFPAGCGDRRQAGRRSQPAEGAEAVDGSAEREAVDTLKQLGANGALDERGRPKVVRLSGPKITDAELEHVEALTELRALYLDGTRVTDAGMASIEPLTKLETLHCVNIAGANQLRTVRALEDSTHLECRDAPLPPILQALQEYHSVPFKIDEEALTRAGISADTLITAKHVDVPLREALDSVLGPLGLVWKLDDGALVVTTTQAVAEERPNLTKLRQTVPTLKDVLVDW